MTDWPAGLDATLAEVWRRLTRATVNGRAAARFPVLATVGENGGAEARAVVVRAANSVRGAIEIFTDHRSTKVRELAIEPKATLVFWDAGARLQARLRAVAQVLTGPEVIDRWNALPSSARADYAALLPPGIPNPGTDQRDPEPDPANFAVLQLHVRQIETVHLGDAVHRRALFDRDDGWRGTWLQP